MAIEYENECVGCPTEMGCMGDNCPNRHVPHLYCDDCGEEYEELYDYEGEQLCQKCLLERFEKVRI